MPAKLIPASNVDEAAQILREGGLVGFPTDTVYGVAAIAETNMQSAALTEFKGGRANPFAVHVHSPEFAMSLLPVLSEIEKCAIHELGLSGTTVIVHGIGIRIVTHKVGAKFLQAVGEEARRHI
ncbi:MAG: L-threonylcarbamoyladenylate synthase [Planctomycetota bacterium]|jgi:tRNA A37 threonylcarbamoyladenosine synthetase subunit TsaC/SUA5/YrdC